MGYYSGHDTDEEDVNTTGEETDSHPDKVEAIPRNAMSYFPAEFSRETTMGRAGASVDNGLKIQRYQTLIASYIFGTLAPEWEGMFEKKNAEYGEYDSELGPLGEAVEIHRKAKKIKRAFIDRVDTSDWTENPREVAMDLIGHLYLLIAVLDEEGAGDDH